MKVKRKDIVLGIDIGGSGIKGAPVNIKTGELLSERYRIATPAKAKPNDVAPIINQIASYFNWDGPIGVGFPAVVKDGIAYTHGNLHKSWLGINIEALLVDELNTNITIINDADAAALAELKFGAAKNVDGTVVILTIGTGIGSGVLIDGKLVPNMELGRVLYSDGNYVEKYAADSIRKLESLSYSEWGSRFNEVLHYFKTIILPDLYIIGGGISKKMHRFEDELNIDIPVIPASSLNRAGIIGAALATQH